jgi:hypothetical protein
MAFQKTGAAETVKLGQDGNMEKEIVLIAILSSLLGPFACNKTPTGEYKVAEIYQDLRQQLFTLTPSKIGISPDSPDQVLAVMMETGYQEAVATLVAIADGTVSLYFSNSGGMIGIGQHEGPRKASMALLSFSREFLKQASLTKSFPLPNRGKTRFYFLTYGGVRSTPEFDEKELGNGNSSLSPLFHKAQAVITQARMVNEKMKAEQGAPGIADKSGFR